ncbi:MAG: DUF4091 domain-containing protein [Deltaproteobacteria bacterium]|nr:DUF4091 domain-containing protein [Deltaproteobacteria bacterium]
MNTRRGGWIFGLALGITWLQAPAGFCQNLVPNGDFEDGAAGWSGGEVLTDAPHGGAACLRVVDGDPASSISARTAESIPVSQGQSYAFEVWVRGAQDGQQALVTLNQHDGADQWISGNNLDFVVTTSTGWIRFRQVIRSFHASTAGVRISLRPVRWTSGGELEGTAWFDDVLIEEVQENRQVRGRWLSSDGDLKVWRSPVEQKVPRDVLLDATAPVEAELRLSAARGEEEPFQIVLLPSGLVRDEALVDVQISPLQGPQGVSIQSSAFSVREVAYVEVIEPTDYASTSGWQPDPLAPLLMPLDLTGGEQQPLWLSLRVPDGIPGGDYTGRLVLSFRHADDVTLPVRVHVWGFDMPAETHLRSAYGLGLHEIDRYHNLGGDPAKRRQVLRLYLEDFAAHRISPQNPFGDDGFSFSFPNWNWEDPQARIVPGAERDNRILELVDDRDDAAVGVRSALAVPIEAGTSYSLSWLAMIDQRLDGDDYLVAVNQYDDQGDWISGANMDFVCDGTGSWTSEERAIGPADFHTDAAAVRITLYARRWTSAGELVGSAWFDELCFARQGEGENLIENGDFDLPAEEIEVLLDSAAFDLAAAHALDGLGFDAFRLGLPGFASGSFQGSREGGLLGFEWGTADYDALFSRALLTLTDHLAARGWLDQAYAYWFDEPGPEDYPLLIEGMDLLQAADPRLKRLCTEQIEDPLVGKIDIWVPLLDAFLPDEAAERQAAGDEVWWYVCCGPLAPYPNNFIDHPGIEHRIRFWMAWQYGVQGSLYWRTNYWTQDDVFPGQPQDPWVDPQSYHFHTGSVGTWGNGDGRLIYPPRGWADGVERIEGPTPSLRWELLREGIEDYEYFWMLREAADELERQGGDSELVARARSLLDLPASLFSSLTEYTEDPGLLDAHRSDVAETLESILDATEPDGGDGDGGDGGADAGSGDGGLDAGTDAGSDAGAGDDAGVGSDVGLDAGADAGGSDAGEELPGSGGCGCAFSQGGGSAALPLVWLGLLLGSRVTRRRRGRA